MWDLPKQELSEDEFWLSLALFLPVLNALFEDDTEEASRG